MNKYSQYERIAKLYDVLDWPFERFRYRSVRRIMWQGVSNDVLDAGVGTGANMPYYPDDARITGLDFSPAMLERAKARRKKLGLTVRLLEGDVTDTGLPSDSFDFVVATFLFCVLEPERQRPALVELARICRPGGEIRILEYAISRNPLRRFSMRIWAPWVRFAYGATFDRNTEQYIPGTGLELVDVNFLTADIIKMLRLRPAD